MSNTIESLELEIVSNSKSAVDGIDALTQSLEKLKSATKGGLGLSSVSKEIGKVDKATKQMGTTNKNTSKSFTNLFYKVKVGTKGLTLFATNIWSAIEKSNDYVENLNLFTVSMGEYASEALNYAETVSDAMGIDTSEWIRAQGVFMTMATGFGVASDRANIMSKNLTQLGYDIASFYNIDTETAMLKLKSGLAGELEPLRAIGYDLSQAKLEATAAALGIDKAVSAMTQAEKAQLRYYAIMTQVTTAQGDMARTLDDPANQLRVLKAQISMAAREIGNIFIPALNAILPYAIAVTKVIRILASNIAGLFGYKPEEMEETTNTVVENTGNVADNLEDAQKEAKKLKSYMLGFDELNVINPNTDNGMDDPMSELNFVLPEYDFMAGLVESKVAEIVEDMKEWLGITEDIDTWGELFETRLGTILKQVGLIGAGIIAWKVTQSFIDAITTLKWLLSNPTYAIAISVLLTISGFTISFTAMQDAIREGLDGFNFAEIIGGMLLAGGGTALLGSKIASWITTAFSGSTVANALTQAAINLFGQTAGPISAGAVAAAGGVLLAAVTGIILGIPAYFVGIYDACMEGIDWLSALLVSAGGTAAGAGIGAIIGMLGGPIGAGVGALIGLAVGLVTDLIILIVQSWDEICAWFGELVTWVNTNVIKPVGNFFKGLWETVADFFSNLWDDIVRIWNNVATWFNENVITPVVNFFRGLWTNVSDFFVNLWNGIVTVWNNVATWFNNNVVTPIVNFFKGIWTSVSGFFTELWNDIVAIWTTVSNWFDENIITPISDFFEGLTMRIGQFFEGCWLIIRAVWVVSSTWFNDEVITPIVNFFERVWTDVSEFFSQLWDDIVAIWKTVSTWFNDNVVTPISNFFSGLWTSVLGFFSSLWDDIVTLWTEAPTWFNETIVVPIVDFFKGVWTDVSGFFSDLWDDIVAVWEGVSQWFDEEVVGPVINFFEGLCDDVSDFFSGLWTGIEYIWESVANWFDETIITPVKTAFETACEAIGGFFSSLWEGIKKGIAAAMNAVIGAIESTINWLIGGINSLIGGFNKVVQWAADVLGEDWSGITLVQKVSLQRIAFAEGGFPEQGQMFIAREAGAEMVGNIGRRTAVANNDQIVSGIAGGVAQANEEQNALLREQNTLLRALLEKDSGVYLDGKNLTNSVEKYQRERGRVLIAGGVV